MGERPLRDSRYRVANNLFTVPGHLAGHVVLFSIVSSTNHNIIQNAPYSADSAKLS
jgi:hypothetical protein